MNSISFLKTLRKCQLFFSNLVKFQCKVVKFAFIENMLTITIILYHLFLKFMIDNNFLHFLNKFYQSTNSL